MNSFAFEVYYEWLVAVEAMRRTGFSASATYERLTLTGHRPPYCPPDALCFGLQ